MSTTFHFNSAAEISEDFLNAILAIYKEKPIFVTIEEESFVPLWQQKEVSHRATLARENPDSLLDFDLIISELDKELNVYAN